MWVDKNVGRKACGQKKCGLKTGGQKNIWVEKQMDRQIMSAHNRKREDQKESDRLSD